jgi:hypothetical protein
MSSSSAALDEVAETKKQYLVILTGSYFLAGFLWTFGAVGSMYLKEPAEPLPFFSSMIVLMLSNALWEVLTGWYADKFRRRFSISGGFLAYGSGFLIMLLASFISQEAPGGGTQASQLLEPRLFIWLVGVAICSLGPALLSGAQEAWLVDRCNFVSISPPEQLDDVFKRAARQGVFAKAAGSLICIFSLYGLIREMPGASTTAEPSSLTLAFVISAGTAAVSSFLLFMYSRKLQEEYWTDPKYQTEESLFHFAGMGVKDLLRAPYRWFTLAFIGATSLNYILSFTLWPSLAQPGESTTLYSTLPYSPLPYSTLLYIAGTIIGLEVMAGYFSGPFSRWIDRIASPRWRMPVVSLMYLAPVIPLYLAFPQVSPGDFLLTLIAATFMFRTAHSSVFGTLNTVGQSAIESDERRAVMVSMSSALAAFFVAAMLWISYRQDQKIQEGIRVFWIAISLPSILMLAFGGYLAVRGGNQGDKPV